MKKVSVYRRDRGDEAAPSLSSSALRFMGYEEVTFTTPQDQRAAKNHGDQKIIKSLYFRTEKSGGLVQDFTPPQKKLIPKFITNFCEW